MDLVIVGQLPTAQDQLHLKGRIDTSVRAFASISFLRMVIIQSSPWPSTPLPPSLFAITGVSPCSLNHWTMDVRPLKM